MKYRIIGGELELEPIDEAPPEIPDPPVVVPPPTRLVGIGIEQGRFTDLSGAPILLKGASASSLESVAIQGWSPNDPWGGHRPRLDAMQAWGLNTIRIPLNQASWLGYTCTDYNGATRNPDPGGNYRQAVIDMVMEATALGMGVILDLHWSAPFDATPRAQNCFMDRQRSIQFWRSVAQAFRGYANVVLEPFNEPIQYRVRSGENPWAVYRDGGVMTGYVQGAWEQPDAWWKEIPWDVVGYQEVINAIRDEGATNVILIAGNDWAKQLNREYFPVDPLGQLAATWHLYPAYGTEFGAPGHDMPNHPETYQHAEQMIAAGIPVAITEIGDHCAPGTDWTNMPFLDNAFQWIDRQPLGSVAVMGWTWNVWPEYIDHVLLKAKDGTPTDGWGQYYRWWATS